MADSLKTILLIEEMRKQSHQEKLDIQCLKDNHYGHDFAPVTQICLRCGLSTLQFSLPSDPEDRLVCSALTKTLPLSYRAIRRSNDCQNDIT